MKNIILFFLLVLSMACTLKETVCTKEGVSFELAIYRKENITDLVYELSFTIPIDNDSLLVCSEVITFELKKDGPLVLDYKDGGKGLCLAMLKGNRVNYV